MSLNVFNLPPLPLIVVGTAESQLLMLQLGILSEYAQYQGRNDVTVHVCYDNHPTHWIMISYAKGAAHPLENGYCFTAQPKALMTRMDVEADYRRGLEASGSKVPRLFPWNQLPARPEMLG